MAKGSGPGATWTADAALQDVLLTSNTAETENSHVSDDADVKAQEDSHADANDTSDASAAAGAAIADPTVDKVIRILGLLPATKVSQKGVSDTTSICHCSQKEAQTQTTRNQHCG